MLKYFIVFCPMILGATLAGTVRAATPLDVSADAAPPSVQDSLAGVGATNIQPMSARALGAASSARPISAGDFVAGAPDRASSRLPEPATWAVMLIGLGLVGAMARRHRAQVAH